MLTFDITNVWWEDGGRNEGGMSVGHWKERNTCVGDEDSADCGKEGRKVGGIGMGGKNGGTRSGMSTEMREGREWVCE